MVIAIDHGAEERQDETEALTQIDAAKSDPSLSIHDADELDKEGVQDLSTYM